MKEYSKTNKPYVREYNENGEWTNPIVGFYLHGEPNRKQRRAHLNQPRFKGNKKGVSLTITPMGKFHRIVQVIDGKRIERYEK